MQKFCTTSIRKLYTLLKGSLISVTETSCSNETKNIRKKLLQDAALCKIEGDVVRILQDCDISSESGSPSGVAGVITGTSMQGTTAFKNAEGKTFADLFKVGSKNSHRSLFVNGVIFVLSSFCFYSAHIDSFISRVARYTPSSAINLCSNKI